MQLDTSMISKQMTYLTKTKSINILPNSRSVTEKLFADPSLLISLINSNYRYSQFWDAAFPLFVTGFAKPTYVIPDNKLFIISAVHNLSSLIEEEYLFKPSKELLDFLLTHPVNAEGKELTLDMSCPRFSLFIKMCVASAKDSTVESQVMSNLLSPNRIYAMATASACVNNLKNFSLVSFAPCSLIVQTGSPIEEIQQTINSLNLSNLVEVREVDGIGSTDWYIQHFR